MKEIIYNIDNATAGRVITITDVDETFGEDNILGIINKTTKKVLYAPTVGALASVMYINNTLTITLADSVAAITAGDRLLIKVYSDNDGIPTECSDEDIDHMFETVNEDDQIIIPTEAITSEGTMPIDVFTALTSLTPIE